MLAVPEGLEIQRNVLSPEFEQRVIEWLDQRSWQHVTSNPKSRRVQHFGYNYNYNSGNVELGSLMGGPVLKIAKVLSALMVPNQCIVNEYLRHQGISKHIDSPVFGDVIIGISIGEDCWMTFRRGSDVYPVFLPRRSAMIMNGRSRTEWTHEISKNVTYTHPDGSKVTKSKDYRRISLTFRTVG